MNLIRLILGIFIHAIFLYSRIAIAEDQPRPRIYVYQLPPEIHSGFGWGTWLAEEIRRSPYHEQDPAVADYFWIPGGGWYGIHEAGKPEPSISMRAHLISILEYVKKHHPWWNRTVALGQARHVILVLHDAGIGDLSGSPEERNRLPAGRMICGCFNIVWRN